MMREEQKSQISKKISQLLDQMGRSPQFTPDQSLFLSGLLDSVSAVQLVVFLEENFKEELGGTALDLKLIDSYDNITKLLFRK